MDRDNQTGDRDHPVDDAPDLVGMTQLLNADADLVVIQDLLGHSQIKTTQRYCKVSNLKVQRDYHKAIGKVMSRHYLEQGIDIGNKELLKYK